MEQNVDNLAGGGRAFRRGYRNCRNVQKKIIYKHEKAAHSAAFSCYNCIIKQKLGSSNGIHNKGI